MAERRVEVWNEPALKKYGDSAGERISAVLSIHGSRIAKRTSTRFESVGAKGKDVGREAGLEESGFVGWYRGSLSRRSHCSNSIIPKLNPWSYH